MDATSEAAPNIFGVKQLLTIMAIKDPLLPSAHFERGIDVVAETARGSNGTADPRFTQFVNYLRSYWLPSTHQPQDNNILSTTFKSPIIHF